VSRSRWFHYLQLSGACCLAPTLHQANSKNIKSSQRDYKKQNPMRLPFNEMHHPLWIRQKIWLDAVGLGPQIRQNPTPDSRADDSNHAEGNKVHAHDAGRYGNDMANHRKQSREENPARLVTCQPVLRLLQFPRLQQNEMTIFHDQRSTNYARDPVSNGRAQIGPEGSAQNNSRETEFALRGQKCRRWNDDLARDRKDRAFHRHQHNDAEVTAA